MPKDSHQNKYFYTRVAFFVLLTLLLAFWGTQDNFPLIAACYGLFFWQYLRVYTDVVPKEINRFLWLGIVLRVLLIFVFPKLSDDIYRFVWDGRLILNGINPFDYLPSKIIEDGMNIPGLTAELYGQLNSPKYFSIYPPLAQLIYLIGTALSPGNIAGSAIVMKTILVGFEIGNIWVITRLLALFERPEKLVLLYALNPLVIFEVAGNLHFEGMMLFFVLLSVYWLVKERYWWSSVAMALAISTKLLPLLFLFFLIGRLGWKRSISYLGMMGVVLVILFLPMLNGVFAAHFGDSLGLYFQNFEFNSSVVNMLAFLGSFRTKDYLIPVIGPLMAAITFWGIFRVALFEQEYSWASLFRNMLFAISLYLALTATVHPWYVILPLGLSLFTDFRYPVLWSGLIVLSYIKYSPWGAHWNWLAVGVEYSLVYAFAYMEWKGHPFLERLKNISLGKSR